MATLKERIEANREEILRVFDNARAAKQPSAEYWWRRVDRYLDKELELKAEMRIEDSLCP